HKCHCLISVLSVFSSKLKCIETDFTKNYLHFFENETFRSVFLYVSSRRQKRKLQEEVN
ncbi:hypothetical protein X975_11452, partial [Stegodyphus mimosarum]